MKSGEAVTVVLVTMFGFLVATNNETTSTTPVKPTTRPMHPTTGAMRPTTGPTTGPMPPTTGAMPPTTGPTTGPMPPTTGPMPPTTGPMHPTTGPMHPTTGPINPTTGPMLPLTTGPTLFTNATAAPNVTSPNMTTTSTTTAPAMTTPPQRNHWEVPGGKNDSCQSMHFYANITVPYYNTSDLLDSVTVAVPSWSNASGTCLTEEREFILDFIPDGGNQTWNLKFVFTADSTAYELTSLNVQFNYDDVFFNTKKQGQHSSSFVSVDSPLAGLNASLGCPCKRDTVQIQSKDKEQLRVAFTDLDIWPFNGGKCVSQPLPPGHSPPANGWMSVGIAFIVMFVVLLLVSVSYVVYVKKYNKQPSDTYRELENY